MATQDNVNASRKAKKMLNWYESIKIRYYEEGPGYEDAVKAWFAWDEKGPSGFLNDEQESMEFLYQEAMENRDWCLRWKDNLRNMFFDSFDYRNFPDIVKAHDKLLEKIKEWEIEFPDPVNSSPSL